MSLTLSPGLQEGDLACLVGWGCGVGLRACRRQPSMVSDQGQGVNIWEPFLKLPRDIRLLCCVTSYAGWGRVQDPLGKGGEKVDLGLLLTAISECQNPLAPIQDS